VEVLVGSNEMMVEVMEGPVELSEAGYVVKGVVDAGEVTFALVHWGGWCGVWKPCLNSRRWWNEIGNDGVTVVVATAFPEFPFTMTMSFAFPGGWPL